MEKIKKYWQFKKVRLIVKVLLLLALLLLVFQAGRFVGFRQAGFAYRLGDNYYRAFEGRDHRGPGPMIMGDIPGGHGATGKIIKISLPNLVVSTSEGIEKNILLNDKTIIRKFRSEATTTDLKVDDLVVVIGDPNNESQIVAKLIRLLPPLPKK